MNLTLLPARRPGAGASAQAGTAGLPACEEPPRHARRWHLNWHFYDLSPIISAVGSEMPLRPCGQQRSRRVKYRRKGIRQLFDAYADLLPARHRWLIIGLREPANWVSGPGAVIQAITWLAKEGASRHLAGGQ
jgi:hypothetical protein